MRSFLLDCQEIYQNPKEDPKVRQTALEMAHESVMEAITLEIEGRDT
jgi:hypothetical protein